VAGNGGLHGQTWWKSFGERFTQEFTSQSQERVRLILVDVVHFIIVFYRAQHCLEN
jgi:hypothetical protein